MANISMAQLIVSSVPRLLSTAVTHYRDGPPMPSWDLRFHMILAMLNLMTHNLVDRTIEQVQGATCAAVQVPKGAAVASFSVPERYLEDAQRVLETLLVPYENVIDESWTFWKSRGYGLSGEWVYPEADGDRYAPPRSNEPVVMYLHGGGYFLSSAQSYRHITWRTAQAVQGRSFVINYRLSPQNQFPAALQDALAAYMYLLNPPKEDVDFTPIDPKRIYFAGDSAGAGLCLSLALAIRDADLPPPAGIIALSAWVDLTYSMPSIFNTLCDRTDYIPGPGLQLMPSPMLNEFHERAHELQERIERASSPQIWHKSLQREFRLQFYAANEALAIPYVSPLLSPSLGNLPPILLQVGDGERLRDEQIYLGFKASNPKKFQQPCYVDCASSVFQTPTDVTLEVYDDMPHVWQMIFPWTKSAHVAFERVAAFVKRVSEAPKDNQPSIKAITVDASGQPQPLRESHLAVLKWNKVGVMPFIELKAPPAGKPRKVKTRGITLALVTLTLLTIGLATCSYTKDLCRNSLS